ncbi:UDP-glucose 4-epimerase family protein [Colwellia psychrerythraea]|uniref:Sugar epimerase family protein n=1 Tax=Colwellia psychrerythraea (strain 34H / ATCC BAA-681) TaxID=167879 RepID=Q489C5_COLP3|nr:SDR family oxidoreductase [Colwellia psychrerythraea]AAZ28046.1 sugar epimerase family protein [Colwellia psychrerythraea 34H]
MKIAITGATGFLGKPLTKELSERFCDDSIAPILRNLSQEFNNVNCIVVGDIGPMTDWSNKLEDIGCVIHCAARVHVMNEKNEDPLDAFREVNVRGTLVFAKAAAKSGVKRFIFVSSIKVNGESTTSKKPYKNSDEPSPKDPYGISKSEAEAGLKLIADETGMEVVIIRPPLVYGPGVKANFAAMLKFASTGIPLPFGCISHNKRSMVYVENLISLIVECIDNPNAANNTFLVSDDNDLSTKEFVNGLSAGLGKSGLMLPVPNALFSIAGKVLGKSAVIDRLCGSLQVDINHTKDTLSWQPPYSVVEGFAATARYFKDQRSN